MDFIGIPASSATVSALCQKHSFEQITGRARGDNGHTLRGQFMYRKGITGDWANHFDGQTARLFQRRFGRYLRAWGHELTDQWAEAHVQRCRDERPSSPFDGTLFASMLQLEQMTARIKSLTGPSRFDADQQIKNLFQSKPRIDLN